jgi:hypothetical protein
MAASAFDRLPPSSRREPIMRHLHSPTLLHSTRVVLAAIAVTLLAAEVSLAQSGRYAVKDDDKDLMLRIENSTFPTWEGTEQEQNPT